MATENWLVNMTIDEVSLVYEGENEHALVEFIKTKKGGDKHAPAMLQKFNKVAAVLGEAGARARAAATLDDFSAKFGALRQSLSDVGADEGLTAVQKARKIDSHLEDFGGVIASLAPEAVISTAVAETMAEIAKGHDTSRLAQEIAMDIDEMREALEAAEVTITKLNKQLEDKDAEIVVLKKGKTVDPGSDEAIFAGMSEPAIAEFKKMRTSAAASATLVAKMAEDAEIGEKTTFLKAKLVPTPDAVGAALVRLSKGKGRAASTNTVEGKEVKVPSDLEVVEQALIAKAAAARAPLKTVGVDVAFGKAAGDDAEGDNPEAELTAKAEEIAKAKKIPVEAAMAEAMDSNPDIYARFKKMKRAQAAAL